MQSLEEQVLRVFYEGPRSVHECAAELRHADVDEVAQLVADLAQLSYLAVHARGAVSRYALTHTGSERLAVLVE